MDEQEQRRSRRAFMVSMLGWTLLFFMGIGNVSRIERLQENLQERIDRLIEDRDRHRDTVAEQMHSLEMKIKLLDLEK